MGRDRRCVERAPLGKPAVAPKCTTAGLSSRATRNFKWHEPLSLRIVGAALCGRPLPSPAWVGTGAYPYRVPAWEPDCAGRQVCPWHPRRFHENWRGFLLTITILPNRVEVWHPMTQTATSAGAKRGRSGQPLTMLPGVVSCPSSNNWHVGSRPGTAALRFIWVAGASRPGSFPAGLPIISPLDRPL